MSDEIEIKNDEKNVSCPLVSLYSTVPIVSGANRVGLATGGRHCADGQKFCNFFFSRWIYFGSPYTNYLARVPVRLREDKSVKSAAGIQICSLFKARFFLLS